MKKITIRKILIVQIILMIVAIVSFVMYSVKIGKIGFVENIKQLLSQQTEETMENSQADAIIDVDITNIKNDEYVEHEHVWFEKYDENNHWKECSVCNEIEELEKHTLTTTWTLGHEGCESSNAYITKCNCGYATNGIKPHTWNGEWVLTPPQNMHYRKCAVCGGWISRTYYIDNTKGGVLIDNLAEDAIDDERGILPKAMRCVAADGSPVLCGSGVTCVECGGPYVVENFHSWQAYAKDNKIRCSRCGEVRRYI